MYTKVKCTLKTLKSNLLALVTAAGRSSVRDLYRSVRDHLSIMGDPDEDSDEGWNSSVFRGRHMVPFRVQL